MFYKNINMVICLTSLHNCSKIWKIWS